MDVNVFLAFVGMCSRTCELVYYCLERRAAYHMDVSVLLSVPERRRYRGYEKITPTSR